MSERTSKPEMLPKTLVTAVLLMTFIVLGLGGAVVALKLRPKPVPTTAVERSLEGWQQAILANPNDDGARVGYGLALLEAGRSDDARDSFQEALSLNPKNWIALLQLGLLAKDTDPGKAVDLLDRSAKYAPSGQKAVPLVAEGDLLAQEKDLQPAESAYRRAIADVPYIFDAHFGLAKVLEMLGEKKEALKEYQEAARFDPSNVEVAQAIARLEGNA